MLTIDAIDREIKIMDLTSPKVIILWKDDDVLLRAVELLLKSRAGWRVTTFTENWDDNDLIQQVNGTSPDVFIVHEDVFIAKIYLFTKFAQQFSRLKIITMSLENNQLNIYKRQTISVREATDLFSIIEENLHADPPGGEKRTVAGL